MKRGLYLAPFHELADPRLLAELARVAESRGWDGLFLWDRIAYPPSDRAVSASSPLMGDSRFSPPPQHLVAPGSTTD
jgi:alkanesulfonate monooxygenase SsuD/methylene tetrahydromethanopterin reductase-like flavin-dependent oxidoreductase (luciferase family)